MNDINEMPPKCQYCPYWEVCEYPWVCPDREQLATNLKQTCYATDTISRQAAIDAICRSSECESEFCGIPCTEINALKALPSAQPERKKGRWIDMDDHVMCSCCGATHYGSDKNFCPNCGADMRRNE